MSKVKNPFETVLEPVSEFNDIVMKAAESAYSIQMESLQAFTKLGIDNINEGMKVRTVEDYTSYLEKQKDIAKKANDMLVSDANAYTQLNTKFMEQARVLAEKNMKASAEAFTEASKKATAAAKEVVSKAAA